VTETQNRFDFEWVRFLGAQMIEAADGRCVMRLRPKSVHLNHNGNVNAPILYGLAEFAGAGAVTTGMTDLLTTAYTSACSRSACTQRRSQESRSNNSAVITPPGRRRRAREHDRP
jgi:hypothetical protein